MRILITGGQGQLGRDLQRALETETVFAFGHRDLDVTDADALLRAVEEHRPDALIHAAALTDTGRCEREPDLAHAVNATGTRNAARACQSVGASLVYISTNEVFDGISRHPYLESDPPNPINAYARSKLAGERYVESTLERHYIVRTAWLYGEGGNHCPAKILAAAQQRPELSVVTDEVATPTWTRDLAQALARLIGHDAFGVYHLTNDGACSRYDWTRLILRLAGREDVQVRPTTMAEYGATPRKPPYSVLANRAAAALGITLRPWEQALEEFFRCARL
jgi:dTDP-4-dehydrorhamnose reductase